MDNNNIIKKKISTTKMVNLIQKHVEGVTGVERQKGTNIWLVTVKDARPEIAAVELGGLGFKIDGINMRTHLIVAEYEGNNTYGEQEAKI